MNAHPILIRYVPPTNTKGSRVALVSQRYAKDVVTDSYGNSVGDAFTQGLSMLRSMGYTAICSGEAPRNYWVAVKQFKPLKTALAEYVAKKGGKA